LLYLPLNVAYGSSSTNCVWFQFDIQFAAPGIYPNPVQWYIWDILGPATDVNNYKYAAIGIPYVIGDDYTFSLTTSGTNTITFLITDQTTHVSWSKNTWDWTIPSTNLLADDSMFSPASCVEGYTTGAALSGIPFFSTKTGQNITINRNYFSGNTPPSGVTTYRRALGYNNLWFWTMLSPGSLPAPSIKSVSYPLSIIIGQSASIQVYAQNNGGNATWQTISIGFPTGEAISNIGITQCDLASSRVFNPGDTARAGYNATNINLSNYLAEGSGIWLQSATHYLTINVKPTSVGTFTFYVKSVAAAKNFPSNWSPISGAKDQQFEFIYSYSITVRQPVVTLSGFSVTKGGSGYTTPHVVLTGGGGTGATAAARVSQGVVIGLVLTNPGTGYTSAPVVTLRDPSPRARGAAAIVNYTIS
jgi:hypothetical protein